MAGYGWDWPWKTMASIGENALPELSRSARMKTMAMTVLPFSSTLTTFKMNLNEIVAEARIQVIIAIDRALESMNLSEHIG